MANARIALMVDPHLPVRTEWDVFLSYSSANSTEADAIVRGLNDSGLTVWFDKNRVSPGNYVRDSINSGLNASRVIILRASLASLKSPWVLKEIDAAMMREKEENRTVLIPILLGRIKRAHLPPNIRGKSHIDLRHNFSRRYASERTHIVNAVQALLGPAASDRAVLGLGDDAIRYILAYKYMALFEDFEVPDDFFDSLTNVFVGGSGGITPKSEKQKFLKNYGHWGVHQILKFFLDHSSLKLTKGFTEEDLNGFLFEVDVFFAMITDQQLGRSFDMRVAPDGTIMYRMVSDSKSA